MSGPASLLAGVLPDLLGKIGDVVDRFVVNPEEKLKATIELKKLENEATIRLAELDKDFAVEQAKVVVAEAQSQSWMARNWRPVTMLTFVFIIAWNHIIAPLFRQPSLAIVPQMWDLLQIGLGGYIVGRSAEKIVPGVVEALKKK